jgi:hypothetical protein
MPSIGLEATPLSFSAGCMANHRRVRPSRRRASPVPLGGVIGQFVLDQANARHFPGQLGGAGAGPNVRHGTREDDRPAIGAYIDGRERGILRQAAFDLRVMSVSEGSITARFPGGTTWRSFLTLFTPSTAWLSSPRPNPPCRAVTRGHRRRARSGSPSDEAPGGRDLVAAIEVVGSEVVVFHPVLEDVVARGEHGRGMARIAFFGPRRLLRRRNCARRYVSFGRTAAQAPWARVVLSQGAPGRVRLESRFPALSVQARAEAGSGDQMPRRWKPRMSHVALFRTGNNPRSRAIGRPVLPYGLDWASEE